MTPRTRRISIGRMRSPVSVSVAEELHYLVGVGGDAFGETADADDAGFGVFLDGEVDAGGFEEVAYFFVVDLEGGEGGVGLFVWGGGGAEH